MEYLDYYDENGNYLGKETRSVVHEKALWHKTVHCWLYDNLGNVFFQIRKEEGTLYTTASGHISAGETISEAFAREIKEEIGIDVDTNHSHLIEVIPFIMDKVKKDGSIFKDRVWANVYATEYKGNYSDFSLDLNEVKGLVLVNAKETYELLKNEKGSIEGTLITPEGVIKKEIHFEEFLINPGETGIGKYGKVLESIIDLTK